MLQNGTVLRYLGDDEIIRFGDLIEDVDSGTYEEIRPASFYDFANGERVKAVRQLPNVAEVVRPWF